MTGMRTADTIERLTPSEDGILRRLFFFENSGATLAPPLHRLKVELRLRDQRRTVREPEVTVIRLPHYA
jgi:hypothetical protein